ncbi:DUF202 domain-containing protein [Rhodococcus sp. IEGM 1304]|uniref:YidH family protein n=1 Tax=Rhodococcus sp. IEGM 1304 TaxID=3082227 RepID=UPI002955AE85|nr:DUF202 domain-containing protein [Rhodococcus sp. IEGM 1304]MDV8129215.1 DUF202 domain-containing protein [Rhodococcus sp. IEGM 1304]
MTAKPERKVDVDEVEPDYRFTLANERTFLAWIRTSLGTLAAGVALHELFSPLSGFGVQAAISLSFAILSLVLATGAYFHWRATQRAIRRGAALRGTAMVTIVTSALALVAVLACTAILVS